MGVKDEDIKENHSISNFNGPFPLLVSIILYCFQLNIVQSIKS
jgi:hypothetical protein